MIINFANLGGGGGGGYVLPVASDSTLGGVKIGEGISIDSGGTISVSGGSGDAPIVITFDDMPQQERADLYAELYALDQAGSGDTINQKYAFYKTVGDRQGVKFQYYGFGSYGLTFGVVVAPWDWNANVKEQVLCISNDGGVSVWDNEVGSTTPTGRIFRDWWYLYYDTTTSGFSYGSDNSLSPITWGTGSTSSSAWVFNSDGIIQILSAEGGFAQYPVFLLRIKTSEGLRKCGNPSINYVELDNAQTFTDEQSNTITMNKKVYYDYGFCVVSAYFDQGEMRFGGLEISFR